MRRLTFIAASPFDPRWKFVQKIKENKALSDMDKTLRKFSEKAYKAFSKTVDVNKEKFLETMSITVER